MTHPDWIEHRREDGERIGWILPEDEGFVVIDLLGRRRSDAVDWFTAEQLLEDTGLGYLAEPFELRRADDSWVRVRLVDLSPEHIRVKTEDWGDVTASVEEYTLPFPLPDSLRPMAR
ncbi:hypothetical protein [Leucobacter sp. M11]|uniref:hypothetical protein n=1 Tax=Leucobacter sp. M11 TaxID=2993565 RepID=UPI002D7E66A8|nr:hypothetical protein [Leucobacter sp. M11]MEB4616010.1 hypothetical protein [Leucobacter sp. M11]